MADENAPKPTTDVDADADADTDAVQMAEDALSDTERAAEELDAATADGRNVDLPNFQQVLADVEASGLDLLHDAALGLGLLLRPELEVVGGGGELQTLLEQTSAKHAAE